MPMPRWVEEWRRVAHASVVGGLASVQQRRPISRTTDRSCYERQTADGSTGSTGLLLHVGGMPVQCAHHRQTRSSTGTARNKRRCWITGGWSGILVTAIAITWQHLAFPGVCGLEIKNLRVPTVVQLGTSDPLILDCDYVYEDREKSGLVVKWYRDTGPTENKTSQQVYQWIAMLTPQDLGILKGRLDVSYEASEDPYSRHRALRILEPSVNLTGDYRCHVSSNYNDAYKSQKMVIYSPAKDMWMNYSKPDPYSVNISCGAEGMFPEPNAEMIMTKGRKKARNRVGDAAVVVTNSDGLYDVTLYRHFNDNQLSSETTFECVVAVPDTTYSIRKSIDYHPGSYGDSDTDDYQDFSRRSNDPMILVAKSTGTTSNQGGQIVGASSSVNRLWIISVTSISSLAVFYSYIWQEVM